MILFSAVPNPPLKRSMSCSRHELSRASLRFLRVATREAEEVVEQGKDERREWKRE